VRSLQEHAARLRDLSADAVPGATAGWPAMKRAGEAGGGQGVRGSSPGLAQS
jgi:hypothetical protein